MQENQSRISPFIRWPVILLTLISQFFILYEDIFFFGLEKGIYFWGYVDFLLKKETLNVFLFLNMIVFLVVIIIILTGVKNAYLVLNVSSYLNLLYIFFTAIIYIKDNWGEPLPVIYSHTFWNFSLIIFSLLCYRVTSVAFEDFYS